MSILFLQSFSYGMNEMDPRYFIQVLAKLCYLVLNDYMHGKGWLQLAKSMDF